MLSKLPIPREHGAWAMFYAPFLIAVLTAPEWQPRVLILLIAMTAFFFAHEPLVTAVRLRTRFETAGKKFKDARDWILVYLLIGSLAGVLLVGWFRLWLLLVISAFWLPMLALHLYLVSMRSERQVTAEFLGVLCLTATAPAARYVIVGLFDATALFLWILNVLYFSSSIFYVKMRVRRFGKKPDAKALTWQCALYHVLLILIVTLLIATRNLPALAGLAFLPVAFRAFWSLVFEEMKLSLRRIGLAELGYTVLFVAFMALGA